MSLPHNDGVRRNPVQQLNRVAKRDPQLYPLLFIMLGVGTAAGYFLTQKGAKAVSEPQHHLMSPLSSPGSPSSAMGPRVTARSGSRVDEWKKAYKSTKGEPSSDME